MGAIGQKENALRMQRFKRLKSNWAIIRHLLTVVLELLRMFVTVTIWIIVLSLLNSVATLLKRWAGLSTIALNTFDAVLGMAGANTSKHGENYNNPKR